ncbi:MAG TPA: universal stress protein UspA [Clostridiales bacterium]|jgi:K+-sensing histidine kinase KdpD|nr:universal stress protein UspA [Clostridiales bacterium]
MKNVMVCVTQQRNCDRLIQYGHSILDDDRGDLFIIHVAHYQFKFLGNSQEGEALEYLYEKAMSVGAQLTVVRSNNVLDTLVGLVEKYRITHVVLGEPGVVEAQADNLLTQFEEKIQGRAKLLVVPQKHL